MNVREYAARAEIMLPPGQRLKAFGKRIIAQSHLVMDERFIIISSGRHPPAR